MPRTARKKSRPSVSRPLAPEARVTIFSILVGRRPFIEGTATIIRPLVEEDGLYEVHFIGEPQGLTRRRIVHPEWQVDPNAALAALLREWRASMLPEFLDDFDLLREPRRRGARRPRPQTRSPKTRRSTKGRAPRKEIR